MENRYDRQKRLGSGASGEVWLGRDTVLGRPVAIKFLHAVDDDLHRELFTAEARMLARLHHPGITTLYDANLEQTKCYLVMEYVTGKSLDEMIGTGAMSLKDALGIGIAVLEAMRYAHARGVVHRDIKPDNVLITDEGTVKLTDFGFANLVTLLRSGSDLQLGTPAYMPPEQVEGRRTDERSDLYSFGIMLFEMLTGRLPFDEEDPEMLLEAQVNRAPTSVREFLPDASLTLEHTLNRLLMKDRERRYPSAEALLNVLRPMLARLQYSASHIKLLTANDTMPLRGRANHLSVLQQNRQQILALQQPRLVVISGEAGIGKSRLVADFLKNINDPVFVGRADQYLYAPFAEIMADIVRRYPGAISGCTPAQRALLIDWLPGLGALLPSEEQSAAASAPAPQRQIEFFETVRDILGRLGPLVIFLEDATRQDEGTTALLRFLLRHSQTSQFFIAAGRPDEDPEATWWETLDYTGIELESLSPDETGLCLTDLLQGTPVSSAAVQAVYRRSHGNPLFIEETMRHMVDTGELARDEAGSWQYRRREKSGSLPPVMINIFRRRLSRLSQAARQPLAVAALLGPEFEFNTWAAAMDGNTDAALNSLDEALGRRLIIDQGDDHYAFNPSNLTTPLIESLSSTRQRLLHQKIAEKLRDIPGVDPGRLAEHYQSAGKNAEAIRFWQLAGQRAVDGNSPGAAIVAFEKANKLQPALENYEMLGSLHRQTGRSQPAIDAFKQALELADTPGDKARLLNNLAFVYWLYDQYRPAYQAVRRALTLPDAPVDTQAISRSHLGMIAWLIGRLTEANQQCRQAVQMLRRGGNEAELAAACNRLGLAMFSSGEIEEAEKMFNQSFVLRKKLNDWWGEAFSRNNLAKVAIDRADFVTAATMLDEAEKMFDRIDSRDGLMVVFTNRGRLLLRQGQLDEAGTSLDYALQLAMGIGKWSSYGLGDIYLLLGELLLDKNDTERAELAIIEGLRLVETAGNREYIAIGYALRTRLQRQQNKSGAAADSLARAEQTAQQVGGRRLPGLVRRLADG